ncbi:DUF4252 domain-containing protein [Chryseolinea soli]|uniref:DUF4252 domain-containing protein n=1 Tax=Chryseolinea soli TaxID=2321403 RepID=A0A385SKG2_9BACT|nr:DUF4252 domain-containing protein [Chryseolinea soli]AYB31454.1 DUF4252 domain-containing protein [Chryseolinea soli]
MRPKFVAGLVFAMMLSIASLYGQTKTTEALHKQNQDALSLFFYNNTLRMLNQGDDKDFDALIKDIEKMKFLMIEKSASFGATQYKKLVANYKAESFEEIMTSRYQGRNFDVFLKEQSGKTQGMVVTVNDSTNLFVLDIVGSIALDKVTTLFKQLDESADIGKKIRDFAKKD